MRIVWFQGLMAFEPQSIQERKALLVIYEGLNPDRSHRKDSKVLPPQDPQEGGGA